MAALPPALLAHGRLSPLAPVLDGALPSTALRRPSPRARRRLALNGPAATADACRRIRIGRSSPIIGGDGFPVLPRHVSRPWLVLREGDRRRWGGDLRRHYLFDGLAARTGARILEDRRVDPLSAALRELRGPRWQVWRGQPMVASTEFLFDKQFAAVGRLGEAAVVDVHDDAFLQNDALGIEMSADQADAIQARMKLNREGFRWLVAPSAAFADLVGLDPAKVVVASNGSDTATVRPAPWPDTPAVAFISGAAPRRGIEELVEAVRIARRRVPDNEASPVAGRDRRRQQGLSRRPGGVGCERAVDRDRADAVRRARGGARASDRHLHPDAGPRLLGLGRAGQALRLPRRGPADRDDATARDRGDRP